MLEYEPAWHLIWYILKNKMLVINVLKCGWYDSSLSFMQFEIVEEYIFIIVFCLVNGQESTDIFQISVSGNFWSNSMCLIVNLMIMIVQIGVSG